MAGESVMDVENIADSFGIVTLLLGMVIGVLIPIGIGLWVFLPILGSLILDLGAVIPAIFDDYVSTLYDWPVGTVGVMFFTGFVLMIIGLIFSSPES